MPYVKELSSPLQNALLKNVVGPIRVELIIDPDGMNLDISDYIDRAGSISITKRKSIRPYDAIGAFSASEVNIRLINRGDYFNHNKKSSPFYYANSRLYADKAAADTYFDVPKGDGDKFSAGMKVYISDGKNTESFTIQSIDTTSYTYYDRITVTAAGTNSFKSGDFVETEHLVGKKVVLRNDIPGAGKIDQFTGILKGLPKLTATYAQITLLDYFKKLLDVNLKANSYKILTDSIGNWKTTLNYSRKDSQNPSNGTLDMESVIIDSSKCKIGQWEIEFTSDVGDFICRDPDQEEQSGNTGTDFYFGISTDYQIKIPTSAWSGSFVTGDKLTFKTTLALGLPVNSYTSIPQMIYQLLINQFGAGLSLTEIDDTAFQNLISEYDEMRGSITFSQSNTVLKAIELLQQHINATVFIANDGKFSIATHRPTREPPTTYSFSPDADIREINQEDYGKMERIFAKYNYDYDVTDYLNKIRIPAKATLTGTRLEIIFPAYHNTDYGQAKATAERIYLMWRRGIKAYEIREKWNYGLALDLNEIYKISSQYPNFDERVVEIFEVRKDILRGEVKVKAYDMNYVFNNYAFADVDYCDRGKVTW